MSIFADYRKVVPREFDIERLGDLVRAPDPETLGEACRRALKRALYWWTVLALAFGLSHIVVAIFLNLITVK